MIASQNFNKRVILATLALLLGCGSLNVSLAQSNDCGWKCESNPTPPAQKVPPRPNPVSKQRLSPRPENRDARFMKALRLGDEAYLAANYSKAEKHYRLARNLAPLNPRPYIGFGNIYFAKGKYAAAAEAYRKVVSLEAKANDRQLTYQIQLYEVSFYLATSNFLLGRYAEAAAVYQVISDYQPENYQLFYYLGRAYFYQQRYADSLQPFYRLVNLLPNDPMSHYWLGGAYYFTGKYSDATKECKKSIDLDANFALGYHCMGLTYAARDKKKDAMKQYRKLLGINRRLAEQLLIDINK